LSFRIPDYFPIIEAYSDPDFGVKPQPIKSHCKMCPILRAKCGQCSMRRPRNRRRGKWAIVFEALVIFPDIGLFSD